MAAEIAQQFDEIAVGGAGVHGKGINHLQPQAVFGTEMVNQTDDLVKEQTGMVAKEPQLKPIQSGVIQRRFKQAVAHKPLEQDIVINLFFGLA